MVRKLVGAPGMVNAAGHIVPSLLADAGFDPEISGSVDATIALAERWPRPEAVFLELGVPGDARLTALREFKGRPILARIPIIAMSASLERSGGEATLQALGANCFIQKPLDRAQVLTLLDIVLGSVAQSRR